MIEQVHTEDYSKWKDYFYIVNDTYYFFKRETENHTEVYENVNEKLINVLERYRKNNTRIRVWYGAKGKVWLEEYDVTGRINRTSGRIKIPILVNNKRSFGGTELLVNCIIRIDDIEEKKTIYKLAGYDMPKLEIKEVKNNEHILDYLVMKEDKIMTTFKTLEKAQNWVDFMTGKRYRK